MAEHVRTVKRVDRAFAFIDLSGFTAFTDTRGDAEAVAVLARFRALVREVAASRAVRVSKWLGDGAMLVAIDLPTLIETVTDIVTEAPEWRIELPLRAGVAHGAVILMEGDDHIGGAVNLAARLCDEAQPNEVLAPSAVTGEPLPANTTARVVGHRKVRGITTPIELVLLEAA